MLEQWALIALPHALAQSFRPLALITIRTEYEYHKHDGRWSLMKTLALDL